MQIKLVLLDVDGTLLPRGQKTTSKQVIAAAQQLQKAGIKVGIATGRNPLALPQEVLGKLKPDYLICCNGAWLLDAKRNTLCTENMNEQEMYALVDYCEDFDYPLAFVYPEGYYCYVEYERMKAFYDGVGGFRGIVLDGEDQDRHLEGMPLAAFCSMPQEALAGFDAKYGHLGLRFMPYSSVNYDIGRQGVDKSVGLHHLLDRLELAPEQVAAVGDGANDIEMLQMAGLGACMADGAPEAQAAADVIVPADGLADFLRGLL